MREINKFKKAKKYGYDAYGIVLSSSYQRDNGKIADYSMHYLMYYVNTMTLAKQEITKFEANRLGRPGDFIHIKIYQGEKCVIDRVDNDAIIPIETRDKLLDVAKNYI